MEDSGEIEWKRCGKQLCSVFYYMIVGEKMHLSTVEG